MNKCKNIGQCLDLNCEKCICKWEQAHEYKRKPLKERIKNLFVELKGRNNK